MNKIPRSLNLDLSISWHSSCFSIGWEDLPLRSCRLGLAGFPMTWAVSGSRCREAEPRPIRF